MKPLRSFVLTAALLFAIVPGSRAGALYLKAAGLYNQPGDIEVNNLSAFKASLKNNTGFSGALGYKFAVLRLEGELQYLSSSTEPAATSGTLLGGIGFTTGKIKETAGFANAYLDFPAFFGLSAYVGAGLGYARINLDDFGRTTNNVPVLQFSGSDSVFGYQGMLGLQLHLFGTATLHGGYRYIKRQDIAVRDVVANAQRNIKLGDNRVFELGVSLGF